MLLHAHACCCMLLHVGSAGAAAAACCCITITFLLILMTVFCTSLSHSYSYASGPHPTAFVKHSTAFSSILQQAQRLPLGDKSSKRKQEVGSRKQKADLGHRRGGDVARGFEVLGVGRTCCRAEICLLYTSPSPRDRG